MRTSPRIVTGWRRAISRLMLVGPILRYLLQPWAYPLFFLRRSKHGLLRSLDLERELLLTKSIRVNGSWFTSLAVPHFPSRAFDHAAARGALNSCAVGTPAKQFTDNVIIAITPQCEYTCKHCYERRNVGMPETVSDVRWREILGQLQNVGVGIIILSGGEPMLRYSTLLSLVDSGDKDRSDFHVHTSGSGVTRQRAQELRDAGLAAAAVGLDDVDPERFEHLRGIPGAFDRAVEALRHFNDAGLLTYTNCCLTPEFVRSGDLWRYFDLMRDLGVGVIQLLEPRPCGGYRGRSPEELFTESDREVVRDFIRQGNTAKAYRSHPLLYSIPELERPDRMGCTMGSLTHFTIDAAGNVNPCVFVPVSFGNILTEDLAPIVQRMRSAVPAPIRRGCPSVLLRDIFASKDSLEANGTIAYDRVREEWNRRLY